MAWDKTKPSNDELLVNFPAQCRANWDALELLTDSNLLITTAKISPTAGIVDTQLAQITTPSKVSGAAITLLPNIPAAAGKIPLANIDTGIIANKIVLLNGSAQIPAIDGSLLTGFLAAQIPSLDTSKITTGVMATARLGSGSASSSNFLRGDSSWAVPTIDPPDGSVTPSKLGYSTVGDIILASANTERSKNNDPNYTKIKEIQIAKGGSLRITWEGKGGSGGYLQYSRVYRNGVGVGAEHTTNTSGYVTFTEDLSGWTAGDLCQLYYHSSGYDGYILYVQNFRIKTSIPTIETVNLD